jgi:hypothetical protein
VHSSIFLLHLQSGSQFFAVEGIARLVDGYEVITQQMQASPSHVLETSAAIAMTLNYITKKVAMDRIARTQQKALVATSTLNTGIPLTE